MYLVVEQNFDYPDEFHMSDIFFTRPSKADIEAYFRQTAADLMARYYKCQYVVYKIEGLKKTVYVSNVVFSDELTDQNPKYLESGDGYLFKEYEGSEKTFHQTYIDRADEDKDLESDQFEEVQ